MNEPPENTSDRALARGGRSLILWLPVVLVMYVLTAGPALHFMGVHSKAVQITYAPLFWVYGHVPPFRTAFELYMHAVWDKNW